MVEHFHRVGQPTLSLAQMHSLLKIKQAVFVHFYCENDAAHTDQAVHFDLDQRVATDKLVEQLNGQQGSLVDERIALFYFDDPLVNALSFFYCDCCLCLGS